MIQPKHVAIIMDGNGRWGIKNSRNYGQSWKDCRKNNRGCYSKN